MKIVVLDTAAVGNELDYSSLNEFGEVVLYNNTNDEDIAKRLEGADIAVFNRPKMNKDTIGSVSTIKLLCVLATGYDGVDIDYCRQRGIAVCNVSGYSTESVVQVTFSLALNIVNCLNEYTDCVKNDSFTDGEIGTIVSPIFHEIQGKVWGIVGYGNIGSRVAEVAKAFGCKVIAFSRTKKDGIAFVELDELFKQSDIISVHLPLNAETRGIVSKKQISFMKNDAILVNMARGAVVDQSAVAEAILNERIGGFATDVYFPEPLGRDNPIYMLKDKKNVCLTPHMAWGALESRQRCVLETAENIRSFLNGNKMNRVDL